MVNLGFLKNNGKLRYPLIKLVLDQYSPESSEEKGSLRIIKDHFYVDKEKVVLTKHEYIVLYLLYKSKGKLVSYDKIGEVLWKNEPEIFSLWAISQIISRLRKKLSSYYIHPQTIRSVRREGYLLN